MPAVATPQPYKLPEPRERLQVAMALLCIVGRQLAL